MISVINFLLIHPLSVVNINHDYDQFLFLYSVNNPVWPHPHGVLAFLLAGQFLAGIRVQGNVNKHLPYPYLIRQRQAI